MSNPSAPTTKPLFFVLGMLIFGTLGYWVWTTQLAPITCDPTISQAQLKTLTDKGIRNTGHGSSLTNLLWIYVGPKWHALPMEEKLSIDKMVSCAATTIDEQGQPTWQAAYYDHQSGKMAALTSKRYGFRLKADESSDAPGWTIP
jgi:hypothetical protein